MSELFTETCPNCGAEYQICELQSIKCPCGWGLLWDETAGGHLWPEWVLYNPIKQARPESTTRRILVANPGEPSIGKTPGTSDPRTTHYQKGFMNTGLHDLDPHWANPKSTQPFKCDRGLHPTQKPVALAEYFIRTYSNPGDLVLDPFAGSGTTGVAAERCGRHALMIETDDRYCDIIKKRMAEPNQRNLLW